VINALKGEMSLVGPRPIMLDQIPNYGDKMNIYDTVPPRLDRLLAGLGPQPNQF
jgi:lipopolysaccharide/colanic/teichoic acid biosynthesis glycosyltransferase